MTVMIKDEIFPLHVEEEVRGRLFLGVLNYKPELNCQVSDAIEHAHWSLHINHKWLVTRAFHVGSSDICDSRNVIVTQFYRQPQFTHALLVDGDVAWEPGAVARMLSHNVDLVLGAYPKRGDNEGFPIKFLDEVTPRTVNPRTGEYNADGLIKIKGGPTGFMLFKRTVIDRMVEAWPDAWYHHPKAIGGKALDLFNFVVRDNKRSSEDMNFCRMWRDLGGDVWCDPHLTLRHIGDKTWAGKFVDELALLAPRNTTEKIIKIPA